MKKETKKNEGPSCACGKVDLYEEWLKNEKNIKEAADTDTSKQTKEGSTSSDSQTK